MLLDEIESGRRALWGAGLGARPLRTAEDARAFLETVGFCLFCPATPPVLAPDLLSVFLGSEEEARRLAHRLTDPVRTEAAALVARLLAEKSAFAVSFLPEDPLIVSPAEFVYVYAAAGERNPRRPPGAGQRGEKLLYAHAFEVLDGTGPLTALELAGRLGKGVTEEAVERSLQELHARLRVLPVGEGRYALVQHWAPEVVKQAQALSVAEGLSALLSRYLETVVAAEPREIEDFFGHLIARSKVAEVVKALVAARELEYIQVGTRRLVRRADRAERMAAAARTSSKAAARSRR
jgi:23S rRNA pseudouridine2605 synthase